MQQRKLGINGPSVGAIGLGTAPMSAYANRPDEATAIDLIVRAAEQGMTLWDTADVYCLDDSEIGYAERLTAQALSHLPADLRTRIVIATKGGMVRPGGAWDFDGRPEHILASVDASLKALRLSCIDLWQLHTPDTKVPFADTLGAIAQAKQAGKIRLVGLSNVSVAQIEEAIDVTPIASVQNRFGFDHRDPETDGTLRKCREADLAFLPYSPLGGTTLAPKLGGDNVLARIAKETGASPQQVVLAWLLDKYELMIPIPGTTRTESLLDSAGASELTLTTEQLEQLEAASPAA